MQDSDGTVRDCGRASILSLFTGPGVTDAARSDLKKELEKKGVRKGTADSILEKVLGSGEPADPLPDSQGNGKRPALGTFGPKQSGRTLSRSISQSKLSEASSADRPPSQAGPTLDGQVAVPAGVIVDVPPVYVRVSFVTPFTFAQTSFKDCFCTRPRTRIRQDVTSL